jgi:DNA-binding LytR/AlgR family response regulator
LDMPVLRKRNDGTSELIIIDIQDVLFVNIENRGIVYHTRDERFHHISTLSELEEHLSEAGFDLLDKTNIVNMNQVKLLDEKHGNIYFDEEPDKKSKYASVAFIKQKLLKKEIQNAVCRNTGKTLTYQSASHSAKQNKPSENFGLNRT